MVLHIINIVNDTKLNFMLHVFYHNKKVWEKKSADQKENKKK